MFAIIIGLIVIALVVTLLLKGYYPQAILFMGGVLLLTCTAIFGWGDLLNAKQTTNFIGFDIFKVFSTGFSSRIAGLGLTLMAIGGFSRYMEHVGASAALFSVFEKPLKLIKSPYVLLGASFLVSQIMVIFVPSHAGLALLAADGHALPHPHSLRRESHVCPRRDRLRAVRRRWSGFGQCDSGRSDRRR